ncbi:hypothetical protein C2G38_2102731 [Gigaspora rosea]|uniref:Uncharacterized protein n=1 Tax=Gigaspora rosea TaxID=44941 RepID=A0A397USL1_9GLOM|nr:hypothetical protein C2G38_2102731 [Gigaspora rosea]
MCYKTVCKDCNKYTWAGCGRHADSVMSQIPKENQCVCKKDTPKADNNSGSDIKSITEQTQQK